MIAFLSLLLARLDGRLSCGYSLIFVPLWVSDALTCVTGLSETARVLRAPSDSPKRNALINQVNRLKGCVCVAAFKALVALRLDGTWPSTPVYVLCSPYYAAAVLRLALHFCKRPLEAAPRRTACGKLLRPRPGTPFNPVHALVVLIALRIDGVFRLSWALTFLPLWAVFGVLGLVAVGVALPRAATHTRCRSHTLPLLLREYHLLRD